MSPFDDATIEFGVITTILQVTSVVIGLGNLSLEFSLDVNGVQTLHLHLDLRDLIIDQNVEVVVFELQSIGACARCSEVVHVASYSDMI